MRRSYYRTRFNDIAADDFLLEILTRPEFEGLAFDYIHSIDRSTRTYGLLQTQVDALELVVARQVSAMLMADQALAEARTRPHGTGNVLAAITTLVYAQHNLADSQRFLTQYMRDVQSLERDIQAERGALYAQYELLELYVRTQLAARHGYGHVASAMSAVS